MPARRVRLRWKLVCLTFGAVLLYGMAEARVFALAGAWLRGDLGGCSFGASLSALRLGRFLLSQVSVARKSRILESQPGGLREWQTPLGNLWAPPKTDVLFVVTEQILDVYEDEQHRVHRGDVVLDCGANIGTFTRKALLQGAKLVVAVEPSPANLEALRRSFRTEIGAGRVIVVPKGVWDKPDTLKMNLYDNSVLDSFVMKRRLEEPHTRPREVELPLTSIDQIVADLRLERVDFIKMDIEGAERQALAGAGKTIARFRDAYVHRH